MKALVLENQGEPFVLKDVPDPKAGPAEAVAKVLACGAGLTIQHYKIGRSHIETPRIIGHEITAEIVEIGPGVSNVKVGDAVTAYYYLNCGYCPNCMANLEPHCENLKGNVGKDCDGGYAEFIKLPAHNFMVLPEGLDYKNHPAEVGVICDAIATPLKVNKRTRTAPGETVAVFGGGGGLGLSGVRAHRLHWPGRAWHHRRRRYVYRPRRQFDVLARAIDADAGGGKKHNDMGAQRRLSLGPAFGFGDRRRRTDWFGPGTPSAL